MEYYDRLVDYFRWRAWSIIKFFQHLYTGYSELERISINRPINQPTNQSTSSYSQADQSINQSDLELIVAIDQSLRNSRQLIDVLTPVYGTFALPRSRTFLQSINQSTHQSTTKFVPFQPINRSDVPSETVKIVSQIAELKKFSNNPSTCQHSINTINQSINLTLSINALVGELQSLAQTPYDQSNDEHERQLIDLWSTLLPNKTLRSRQSIDWELLGFQGSNPATDFRGAGILGLIQLLAFSKNCPSDSQNVLADCRVGGLKWFSFAITGLNLTFDLIRLTSEHALDRYYMKYGTSIDAFHALYSTVFVRFNQAWRRHQPKSVMEFAHIRASFLTELRRLAEYAHLDTYEHLQPLGEFYERLEPKQKANQSEEILSETCRLLA